MRDYCFYVLYRAGSALVGALPLPVLFLIGQIAGFCAWVILPKYRRLALRNAVIAFGREKSPSQLRRLVRHHFPRLGANLLSTVKLAMMPLDKIERRIEIENLDVIHRELRAGRPVVLILSHLGNWELCAQILPKFIGYVRNSTIYQSLGNRFIDEHVRKLRGRFGVEMFDRKEGFQKAIQLLRGGGAIGILSDQHAGDQGLWVPFFGRLASTTPLPALLAKRTDAALVGIAFYTEGRARWRIVVEPALETKHESVESLTGKANDLVASQIRRAPEDWFWVHDRWKTPRPNFLLSKYKRGVYLPGAMSAEQLQTFRILVRSSNWLGDAVMSVPAVRAIKHGRPDAHLTVASPENIAPMWKLIPEVDEVISLKSKSLVTAVRAIRAGSPFDAAVLFPNSLRVALESWLSRIPRRVGYRGHARALLLNQIVKQRGKPRPPEHQSRYYLRIAEELGAKIEHPDAIRDVWGKQPSTPKAFASRPLNPESIRGRPSAGAQPPTPDEVSPNTLRFGLCPGAEYGPAKQWLPERFAEVAASIAGQYSAQWILFGTQRDAHIGETIAPLLGDKCVNRIGQTTLQQLIEELQSCRLLLTNDTGTMHLATLLGVPVVAIFGSTEPGLTGPLGNGNIVLRHHVECSPCFLRQCPIDFRCMKSVTVDEVVAAVSSILQNQNEFTPDSNNTRR